MESFFYLFKGCKADKGEKNDNGGEYHDKMRKDENSASNSTLLDTKSNVYFDIDVVKSEKIEKKVGAIMKSSLSKITNLKLIYDFVANYLVGITPLENPTFNTLDEANITTANFLADIITNSFSIISPINSFNTLAGFFIKNGSLGILMLANSAFISTKSFTNKSVTLVGSFTFAHISFSIFALIGSFAITLISLFVEVNTLGNYSADVLSSIKFIIELAPNTSYQN